MKVVNLWFIFRSMVLINHNTIACFVYTDKYIQQVNNDFLHVIELVSWSHCCTTGLGMCEW